ncbi:MAG TPA: glycosyltransferase family 9 protein [Methylophilaceae bacterium]|nr:glycosyltransferase family 9 protein [Methylophilaceae bacterium]
MEYQTHHANPASVNSRNIAQGQLLKRPDITSVVIFRALQLGDMLCSVPALRALRAALPAAHITLVGLPWAQQFADRFKRYIDEFIAFPGHPAFSEQPVQPALLHDFYQTMRSRRFSLALQMHGSGEVSNGIVKDFDAQLTAGYASPDADNGYPGFYRLPYPDHGPEPLRLLDFVTELGAPFMGTQLEFPLTAQDWDELKASGLGAGLAAHGYLCIHPGARFRDKCWPPQRFAEIADALAREFGLAVVLTGSAKETDLTRAVADCMTTPAIDAAAPISIGAMAALMSEARLLVCNDTGVSHIAAGLGLNSVVVFSKADITRWAPLASQRHRCIQDAAGDKAHAVLAQARQLLAGPH